MTPLTLPPTVAAPEPTPLEAQRSVPVSGFSSDLRGAPDVERFRFGFAFGGDTLTPVHVVYSPALRTAEVKTGHMKALRIADIGSADEARLRFAAWWRSGRPRKPAFAAPGRLGRAPAPVFTR